MGEDIKQFLWITLASLAGAITALSLRPFDEMSLQRRFMVVFVGFVFAIFVGPLIVDWGMPSEPANSRSIGGLYFLIAAAAYTVLPAIVNRIGTFLMRMRGPTE